MKDAIESSKDGRPGKPDLCRVEVTSDRPLSQKPLKGRPVESVASVSNRFL